MTSGIFALIIAYYDINNFERTNESNYENS